MESPSAFPSRTSPRARPVVMGITAALSLAGIALLVVSTPWNIGVGYDSVFYLSSAQSLLEGRGLSWPVGTGEFEPLIHYPPLYPLLLAGIGSLGIDLTSAARLMGSVLFGANILLVGLLVARTSRFAWAGPMAAAVALVSPILLGVHLMAMTEGLFLCLLLLTMILLISYLESGRKSAYWWAASFSALAALTRYAGPAVAAASFLALVLLGRDNFRRRLRSGLVFTAVSLLPLLFWYGRNLVLTGEVSNRELTYHPLSFASLKGALVTVSEWWIPPDAASLVKKVGLIFVLGIVCALSAVVLRAAGTGAFERGGVEKARLRVPLLLVFFMLTYVALVLTSLTFVDASTRLNDRILSPVYVTSLVLVGSLIGLALDGAGIPRWLLSTCVLLMVLVLAAYSPRTFDLVKTTREQGRGFTGREWQSSETVALVNKTDMAGVVYSSEALPLYYLTGKAAYWVPEKIDPLAAREIADYPARLAEMRRRLAEQNGYLVLFDRSFNRVEMPPVEEVVADLALFHRTVDGSIWTHPQSNLP